MIKINNMEWISIKDRLPDQHTPVLVGCFKNMGKYVLIEDRVFIGQLEDSEWVALPMEEFVAFLPGDDDVWMNSCVRQEDVTHWTPIPEPPIATAEQ